MDLLSNTHDEIKRAPFADSMKNTSNQFFAKENYITDLHGPVLFETGYDRNKYGNEPAIILLKRRVEDLSAECMKYRQLYQLASKENEDLKSLLDDRMKENKSINLTTVHYLNERHQNLIDSMKAAHENEVRHLNDLLQHKNQVS